MRMTLYSIRSGNPASGVILGQGRLRWRQFLVLITAPGAAILNTLEARFVWVKSMLKRKRTIEV